MKIKLALFLADTNYAKNFEDHLKKYFSDKLELYIYSNKDSLKNGLTSGKTDILILDEGTADAMKMVGEEVLVIFLVAEAEGVFLNEISKYQRIENIYKILLNLYADRKINNDIYKDVFRKTLIYAFQSVNGGAGATTIALSCAKNLVLKDKRVFYLNMEELESTYLYMDTDGSYSMDDVLFALKSKRGNLDMKIESAVRQSKDGIYYFYPCTNLYDMKEITAEDIRMLIHSLTVSERYDVILIDQRICVDIPEVELMQLADKLFWVSNGTAISKCKFMRAEEMIRAIDKKNDSDIMSKINIIYNGFSNKNGREIAQNIDVFAGFPKYENMEFEEIVNKLSQSENLNKLLN